MPDPTFVRGPITSANAQAVLHPESYRREIYKILPRTVKAAPMTAFLLALSKSTTLSRVHHWTEEPYPFQNGTVIDVYTKPTLNIADAYAGGGTSGQTLYIAVTANEAKMAIPGKTIEVISDYEPVLLDVRSSFVSTDTDSYLVCQLLMDDTSNVLAAATPKYSLAFNAQAEYSQLPDGVAVELEEYYNLSQIFMGSYSISNSEATELERFAQSQEQRLKANSLIMFHDDMEGAILRSRRHTVWVNGKRKQYMDGLYWMLRRYLPTNIIDLRTYAPTGAPSWAGKSWIGYGFDAFKWLNEALSRRSNEAEKSVYCQAQALIPLDDLVRDNAQLTITQVENSFGLNIRKLKGPIQTWNFIEHPRMTNNPAYNGQLLVTEMGLHQLMPKKGRAVQFVSEGDLNKNGFTWVDGKKAGWYGEYTFESHNFEAQAWINGWGSAHS